MAEANQIGSVGPRNLRTGMDAVVAHLDRQPAHLLPEVGTKDRQHVLTAECWCGPTGTTYRGRSFLQHHAEPLAMAIRTPPRRRRWMRGWRR